MAVPIKIAGLGCYLPERVVPSREVEALCGMPAGWVERRTGVRERRWVDGETSSFMAAQAIREAAAQAGLALDDIDLILNASGTQEQAIPDGGPLIQRHLGLGASGVPCFSVHATCLSFLVALDLGASLLMTGRYRHLAIVSADIASPGLNFEEPESAALMGDAAAAVVLTRAAEGEASSFKTFLYQTFGEGADLTVIRGAGTRKPPNHPATTQRDNQFHMEGPQVLKLASQKVPAFLEMLQPGLSSGLEGIDLVVPHQASRVGLRMMRRFGWPDEQVMITLDRFGNCVAASIPLTLYWALQEQRLQRGDDVLLVGTGAGLSVGGMILTY